MCVCVCVCVYVRVTYDPGGARHGSADLSTALRMGINGQQMVFYLSLKNSNCLQFRNSCLNALYRTSYGHAHLLKFKVHFKGKTSAVQWE